MAGGNTPGARPTSAFIPLSLSQSDLRFLVYILPRHQPLLYLNFKLLNSLTQIRHCELSQSDTRLYNFSPDHRSESKPWRSRNPFLLRRRRRPCRSSRRLSSVMGWCTVRDLLVWSRRAWSWLRGVWRIERFVLLSRLVLVLAFRTPLHLFHSQKLLLVF